MTVWEDLFSLFSNKLDGCFIKRDAFLNHVISVELDNLKKGLKGRKNSVHAKKHIASNLSELGTKTINVVVDKQVAKDLNSIVKEHNLVRDAFINRLLLLLSFPDNIISYMFDVRLVQVVERFNPEHNYVDMDPPPRTFIDALEFIQSSPNRYIQDELDLLYEDDSTDLQGNLYTKSLDVESIIERLEGSKQRDFFQRLEDHAAALSCYLEDSAEIPNTTAWKKNQEAIDKLKSLFKDLDLPKKGL